MQWGAGATRDTDDPELSSRDAHGRRLAAQSHHGFQVEGLREEVGESDVFDGVSRANQRTQVAGQRCRVARDINHGGSGNSTQQRRDVRAQAGARRVSND